ncbi:hypothetical protein ABEU81_30550 [Priestia megaterium]|nr:hypothetical protein DZB86_30140 [Bacillus sp. RC]
MAYVQRYKLSNIVIVVLMQRFQFYQKNKKAAKLIGCLLAKVYNQRTPLYFFLFSGQKEELLHE